MNYFAHGCRFTDRPFFLVGTALPDLLSVVDRQVRLRERRVSPCATGSGEPHAEIAAGVLQHFADDAWFHRAPAFFEVSGELTRLFRAALAGDDGHRPALLGHIVTEMLLDGILIAREPARLEAYYAAFDQIDPQIVEHAVNGMARHATDRLAAFIPLFCRERFLGDYLDAESLLWRLNQVLRRVKLHPLPAATRTVLDAGWTIVEQNLSALLPGF